MAKPKLEFVRGETKMLYDGRMVTILEPVGRSLMRILNNRGMIETVGRSHFRPAEEYNKTYGQV